MTRKTFGLGLLLWLALCAVALACPKGGKKVVHRKADTVLYTCTNSEGHWHGLAVIKDTKGNLLAVGKYRNGKAHGQWTQFNKGRVVAHPLFDDGVLISKDSMTAEEEGDGQGVDGCADDH